MRKEPAVWISLIGAVLVLATVFGLHLSGVQSDAILKVAEIVVPLIMGGTAVAIRSQVYNAASAQTALNMPPDSQLATLDKVLAAGVEVRPGDTHTEIAQKVNAVL